MKISKTFRSKNDTGSFDEDIYFAVDSENVDFSDGQNLQTKMTAVNSAISSLQAQNGTLQETINKVNTTANSNAQSIKTLSSDVSGLNGSVTIINNTVTNLQTSINTLNSKTSSLEGQIVTHTSDIANLKTNVSNITKDISSLNDELALTCRFQATSLTCVLPDNL